MVICCFYAICSRTGLGIISLGIRVKTILILLPSHDRPLLAIGHEGTLSIELTMYYVSLSGNIAAIRSDRHGYAEADQSLQAEDMERNLHGSAPSFWLT
jgi:hypothetical protein